MQVSADGGDFNLKHVTVLVEHTMGADALLDAGVADGSADASATMAHYVTTIYLRAFVEGRDTIIGLWEFSSADAAPPSARFTLPKGVTRVVVYERCTLHGLWKSDSIPT